jgi:hypothetical protein
MFKKRETRLGSHPEHPCSLYVTNGTICTIFNLPAVLWIRITLLQIRMRILILIFYLMRIRIRLFILMWIWIPIQILASK